MDRTTTPDGSGKRELFLVEGVSAASTVRQAMDTSSQSVFALQGKVINAAKAPRSRVEENRVCAGLFAALGCGIDTACDPSKLSCSHIVFLTDPDADGVHARALLATLFARYLAPLVRTGLVSAVIPPLARLTRPGKPALYAYSENDITRWRDAAKNSGASLPTARPHIMRYRSVAQFSPRECVELLLNRGTRRQVRLSAAPRTGQTGAAPRSASY